MLLLCAAMVVNSITPLSVFAEEETISIESEETPESGETAGKIESEETGTEETIGMTEGAGESIETAQTDEANEVMETETEEDIAYEIVDVSIKSKDIFAGDRQTIQILLNNCQKVTKATLRGNAEDKGAEIAYDFTAIEENALIFEIDYNQNEADRYAFTSLILETENGVEEYDLSAFSDILAYSVYSVDIGNSVDNGISLFSISQFTGIYGNDGKFVIVLDPGHDPGCNTRDWINGVWETDLNWRIALAMKAELEKYDGVEVYINREWSECPEESDGMECLEARVTRAANLHADLLISLHNNAMGSGSYQYAANGTGIYISKYSDYYLESKGLAEVVMRKLSEMGLGNRGIRTRDYGSDGGSYDDGNTWDYYAINRHGTMMGIPSLLIEHAYMDNPGDLSFLRDSAKVDEMGRRDAQAIVEYYGLQYNKESGEISVTPTTDGQFDIEITGVKAPYVIEKIYVPVWSAKNGQDDLVWYEAQKSENTWHITVDFRDHNMDDGTYNMHLYYIEQGGVNHLIKTTNAEAIVDHSVGVDVEITNKDSENGNFTIEISNLSVPYRINKVLVPVWSEENDQDDLVWYEAQKSGSKWVVNVKGSEHRYDSGKYQIHVYVCDANGAMHGVKSTSTEITVSDQKKEKGTLAVVNKQASGDFTVQIKDVNAPYEISKVYIPIWSNKNGQDDLIWYEAKKQGNVWNTSVDVGNHKLDQGKYNIHLYYAEPSGAVHFISSMVHDVAIDKNLKPAVSITNKDDVNGNFTVEITNLRPSYSIGKVYVPVWSDKDGQDDLVWYVADKVNRSKWKVDVKSGNHKYTTGQYQVHSYVEEPSGALHFIQGITTQVQMDESKAERGKLSIVDNGNGSFTITVNDVHALYSIKNVRVPVWSEKGGQDDLNWYIANRNGNTASLVVSKNNHRYDVGKYNVHLYYEDMAGVEHYIDGAIQYVN